MYIFYSPFSHPKALLVIVCTTLCFSLLHNSEFNHDLGNPENNFKVRNGTFWMFQPNHQTVFPVATKLVSRRLKCTWSSFLFSHVLRIYTLNKPMVLVLKFEFMPSYISTMESQNLNLKSRGWLGLAYHGNNLCAALSHI